VPVEEEHDARVEGAPAPESCRPIAFVSITLI